MSSAISSEGIQPCAICLADRFRAPVQVCSFGHCLDIGCLFKLVKSTPLAEDVKCPMDASVIDLTHLIYREDIVKTQGDWVEVSRRSMLGYSPLNITVATTTKIAELAPLYHNDCHSTVSAELHRACSFLKGKPLSYHASVAPITRLPFSAGNELFPSDPVARPGDEGTTIKIYASILSRAYCRDCAPTIEMHTMDSYTSRVERQALVDACVAAGHTDVVLDDVD